MANLLKEALNGVSHLLPLQKITIRNKVNEMRYGFPTTTHSDIVAYAHAQPLTPSELQKLGETLKSKIAYKFYLTSDLAQVLNALNNENSAILWKSKEFEVHSKDDWSQNGWIKVIATATATADTSATDDKLPQDEVEIVGFDNAVFYDSETFDEFAKNNVIWGFATEAQNA